MALSFPARDFALPKLLERSGRFTLNWVAAGRNFIFPPGCLCCGIEVPSPSIKWLFCDSCHVALTADIGPECSKCAAPVGPYLDHLKWCIHCRDDRFHFERVVRLGVYREQLGLSLIRAKKAWGIGIARTLADVLYQQRVEDFQSLNCQIVVPIPHYWTRRFSPIHSASETIAERLAQHLRLPLRRRLLRKTRWTPWQAGSPPSVRRKQQKNAFAASRHLRGMRVLLVDDVLTTGATADEAAKALLASGASSVVVAVIARGLGQHA